jgi:chromosome partitioning protein
MIIALVGWRGGTAKTTTAVNLAAALLEQDSMRRILLIDVDVRGSLMDFQAGLPAVEFARISHELLKKLPRDQYDDVLIDCPGSPDAILMDSVFSISDQVLFFMRPTYAGYVATCGLIESAQAHKIPYHVVVTRFEMRKEKHRKWRAEAWQSFPDNICATTVRHLAKFEDAEDEGKSIFDVAPQSTGAIDYRKLAKEVDSWR